MSRSRWICDGVASAVTTTTGMSGRAGVGLQRVEEVGARHVGEMEVEEDEMGTVLAGQLDPEAPRHGRQQLDHPDRVRTCSTNSRLARLSSMCRTRSVATLGSSSGGDSGAAHGELGCGPRWARSTVNVVPSPKLRVHLDGPAHALDQVLRQREPDTGALHPAGLGPQPVEGLEDPVDVLGP